ncbi:MAG: FAD-dependent oxidoreductase [bacterium]|nr:FAD-dependent oxidoreductase [bacterium]
MNSPIILGAGLAGLSAAYYSGGIVYEKDKQVGGRAKSRNKNGFVFDEGIHVLHTKNEEVLSLIKQVGANLQPRQREAWIYSYGAMTRYPFQANTFGLPVNIVKDCLIGFINNDFKEQGKIKNYADWLYFMFGKGIAEHFMLPYSQKFWGVAPSELNTEWVDIRHPKPTLEEVIEGALTDQKKGFGVNAEFLYPAQGGFGAIAESLANSIKNRIKLSMAVTGIDFKRKEIEFNHREKVNYEKVISTLPLPELVDLIKDVPIKIKEAAQKLRYNSILAVNLGINRPQITNKHWIYYHEPEYCFFRISFPFNKASSMALEGASSVAAEISYGNNNPLPVARERVVEKVIVDLQKAKILQPDDQVLFSDVVDIKYGYVIYSSNREAAVQRIKDYLRENRIYAAGRYGEWAYLWSDEAILSGRRVAEEAMAIK